MLLRLKVIFQNKVFIGFCFVLLFILVVFDGLIIFFVDFFEQKGFNCILVVWLYFGMSIVSMIFRFILGLIVQSLKVLKLVIFVMCVFFGCISLSLFLFMILYLLNVVVIVFYGIVLGGVVIVIFIMILELVGEKIYLMGFGIVLVVFGIVNIVGVLIVGKYMVYMFINLILYFIYNNLYE